MSKRLEIQQRWHLLGEISGIMGAMKNLSLIETRKLGRYLANQQRIVTSIEAAAIDFLQHHPQMAWEQPQPAVPLLLLIGSERGFCGDFNELLVGTLNRHLERHNMPSPRLLVIGRRLAAKFEGDPRVAAFFDGPSVTEEVQQVLERIIGSIGAFADGGGAFSNLTVFSHREAGDEVAVHTVLPIRAPATPTPRYGHPPWLNQEPDRFFPHLLDHYLLAVLNELFYNSLMVENHRRLQHMERAIQRMEQKIGELRLKHNALRQEEITEEIEIIMLSAEALQLDLASRVRAAE
jgi:F-type H+-transporting ATPase subunit gamma